MTDLGFDGKVAIITGAGQGIGAATARRFAQEGAKVVLAARRLELLQSVAGEIEADGGTALARSTDIADEDAVRGLVSDTVEAFGGVDIVVNNAVLMVPGMLATRPRAQSSSQPAFGNGFSLRPAGMGRAIKAGLLSAGPSGSP